MAGHDDRSMRNRIRLKLVQAGYRSDRAFYNFLAAKILLPILLAVGYLVSLALYKITADSILIIVLLILAGYFFPNVWIWLMMKSRQERIFKGLPDALDLMVVCVEAGLGLDMTFKRVGEEIKPLCKDLSDEFTLTNLEIRAGKSRDEAFKNMSLRANSPEVHNLMTVLTQTSRFGTSLASALRVHADAMRVKRRQIAEETAAKSTVKLVFPLVLFIFPAIFVVIIGPGAIQIIRYLLPALGGK
jgi:tight adherence protein C